MTGNLRPVALKVSLRDNQFLIRRITECERAAASLQRRADLAKVAGELGSDALSSRDDCERDSRGNQPIFDGGGTGLIGQKFANGFHAIVMEPILESLLNPIAETQGYLDDLRR